MNTEISSYPETSVLEPTGGYYSEQNQSEAHRMALKLNNELLKTPTNPHVGRMYRIIFDNKELKWALPSSVSKLTNIRQYFLALLNYQTSNQFVRFNLTSKKFDTLYSKFYKALSASDYIPNKAQRTLFIKILHQISRDLTTLSKDHIIKISADNDLLLTRNCTSGTAYLVIGPEENDLSFLLISEKPGEYKSRHLSDPNENIDTLIKAYLSE